jgi:hypothetical protein
VIDAELGREDHSSILHNYDRKGWNHLISELTPEPDSIGGKIKVKKLNGHIGT